LKTLRLTIYLDNDLSQEELTNTFGDFEEVILDNKYLQFRFDNVRMLSKLQLTPIYNLIEHYEKRTKELRFKMLHLFDDADQTHSPISLQCLRGNWIKYSINEDRETQQSRDLLTLV